MHSMSVTKVLVAAGLCSVHPTERFQLCSLMVASCSNKFESVNFWKCLDHISVFLGHPISMWTQSSSLENEIGTASSCGFCIAIMPNAFVF